MWTGIAVIVAVIGVVALGQWWVTRPSDRRPVDTRRGRAEIEARHGKDPSQLNDTAI
jgi:hypothetical protein